LPLNQAIPDGEIDVHAIAIATTSPAPDLDHSWIEDNDGDEDTSESDNAETSPPSRRWLRRASELAFRKGFELQPPANANNSRSRLSEEKKEKDTIQPSSAIQLRRRRLAAGADNDDAIVPGRGWETFNQGDSGVKGFCDGSAQSECNREPNKNCMIYGQNDKHVGVWGNALSGWIVFTLPNVREGIILARLEWWCGANRENTLTKDWTEVNGGNTLDTTPWNASTTTAQPSDRRQNQRKLGKKPKPDDLVPKDFEMDYAINGVVKTMDREEWLPHIKEFVKNVAVWPLLNDESMAQRDWDGEPVEVAIRFRSKTLPKQPYCFSHVYYA